VVWVVVVMTEEYFREFFDVYLQGLQVMKEREDNGFPNNEGLYFFRISNNPL
jgi:hypothetical protein